MPAEILSLDMDWFNILEYDGHTVASGRELIRSFFEQLKKKCTLPKVIDLVPEHQYLYPWSLKILDGITCRKVNVVNIDEHHDFYCLGEIDFDDKKAEVGCWNFFAFMAHKRLLGKYTWVTNESTKSATKNQRNGLLKDLRFSNSMTVRKYKDRVEVVDLTKVFDVVEGRHFDGFMIIRSPEYTLRRRSIYHAVELALQAELPRVKVRRYQCRTNFSSDRVRHRANSLFRKL